VELLVVAAVGFDALGMQVEDVGGDLLR
jgi:hypothetical protein